MIDKTNYTLNLTDRIINVNVTNKNNKLTWGAFEKDIIDNMSSTPLKYFQEQQDGHVTVDHLLSYNQDILIEQTNVTKFKRESSVCLSSELTHVIYEYTIKFQQRNCFNNTIGKFTVTFRKPMSTRKRLNLIS